jgi:hypothetical protein
MFSDFGQLMEECMGTDYARRLREQGRVVAGYGTSLGSRAWWLWQEMTVKQRTEFCSENGICEPKPPEWKILGGVGPDCARQFATLWCELTLKQRRAFLARARLDYLPYQEPIPKRGPKPGQKAGQKPQELGGLELGGQEPGREELGGQ